MIHSSQYTLLDEVMRHSFELQKMEVRLFPLGQAIAWCKFIDTLQKQSQGKIPEPFPAVERLAKKYLTQFPSCNSILDIGCETGKNAAPLIQAGHSVTLLDVAPLALYHTVSNLKKRKLAHGIADTIVEKIENLEPRKRPFKAVVGTYAFSFIPPELFQKVMRKNVLSRIEPNGYFAGGFFGPEHIWAQHPDMTFVTIEKIKKLFLSCSFTILEIFERKENRSTSIGLQFFHIIEVIAKRVL